MLFAGGEKSHKVIAKTVKAVAKGFASLRGVITAWLCTGNTNSQHCHQRRRARGNTGIQERGLAKRNGDQGSLEGMSMFPVTAQQQTEPSEIPRVSVV